MTDNELTTDEFKTLAMFQSDQQPLDIDPQHFAKLLSLALIEQREGGSHLTASGTERLSQKR